MRIMINLLVVITYAIICYFTFNFMVNLFNNVDSISSAFEFTATGLIVLLVNILSGYFCYKINTDNDTM